MEIKINIPVNLKKVWDENPLAIIGIGAFAAVSASKLIDSVSRVASCRAYVKKMNKS